MQINQFTANDTDLFLRHMKEAMAKVGEDLGIKITLGRCTYLTNNASLKITASVIAVDGTVESPERVAFRANALYWGMTADLLDKKFVHNGLVHTVAGYRTRSRTKPILTTAVGKTYIWPLDNFKRAVKAAGLLVTETTVLSRTEMDADYAGEAAYMRNGG